jgi:hypothetical protein
LKPNQRSFIKHQSNMGKIKDFLENIAVIVGVVLVAIIAGL